MAGYDGINVAKYLEPKMTTIEQSASKIVAKYLEPKMTTIEQSASKIGAKAAEKLIGMIEKPKTTLIDRTVVEGVLLPGGSVKDLTRGRRISLS